MGNAKRLVGAAALLCAASIVVPTPAVADPFGYPNPGYEADSSDHWYCYTGSVSGDEGRIADAMTLFDAQTVLTVYYAGSTCGSATDVVWLRDDTLSMEIVGGSSAVPIRGVALCVSWSFWGVCDQFWTVYNRYEIFMNTLSNTSGSDIGPNYELNARKTMGHELGHTAGLSHNSAANEDPDCTPTETGTNDAMRSGWVVTSNVFLWLNAHHTGCHINIHY